MPMMRRASVLEYSTSSSNVSGLMSWHSSVEGIDEVAAVHPATCAKVCSSSQVYASTPLPGAKVNLDLVGSWPSPVRTGSPYSLRQNLHSEMKQMKKKNTQDSLEVKQSPLRRRNINLSELMISSDEESEKPHHSTALEITHKEVNNAGTQEGAVRTRSHFYETRNVVKENKRRSPSKLTEAKLEEVHNRRERNGTRKRPKKMISDWDDLSVAKGSGHALRNLQLKPSMKTLKKKEVTFHLPNRSSTEEQKVSRTNVKINLVKRNIFEDKGRRKEVPDKNQIEVHAEVDSEDTAENESDVMANGDPAQHSGSKTLQDHKSVTRKQKKVSPKEIPQNLMRSRRKSETDNEDDPIQSSGSETLQDHESITGKRKKMPPEQMRRNSPRSSRKSETNNEDGVRRSKRKKVRRLEYWRGERIEYKVGNDNCREVVGISAGNPDFNQNLHKHKAKQKNTLIDLLDRDEDFSRNLIPMPHGNSIQTLECFSKFRMESETLESGLPVLIGLEAPGIISGIMIVEPATVMSDLINKEFKLIGTITTGTVTVKINKSKETRKKNQMFYVPKGIRYSVSNMSHNEAVISFTLLE